jgi:tol-pal system protein YbgF
MLNNFPGGIMRPREGIIIILTGIFFLAAGCANQDVIVQKQTEMEARLEFLIQSNNAATKQINDLSNELKDIRERQQVSFTTPPRLESENVDSRISGIKDSSEKKTVEPMSSVAKIELINRDASSKGQSDEASAAYMKAFGLYSTNKYGMAIDSFNSFLQKYPSTEYAINAQYWLGECYYTKSDFPNALNSFNKLVELYPKGKKVPDALLKIGYTLLAMKEPQKARSALASLIERFPDSPASDKAREKLKSF